MLIGNGPLITCDPEHPFYPCGAVFIENGAIRDVGALEDVRAAHPGEPLIDVGGKLMMPGLINAHTHIYSAYARGMAVHRPTRHFVEILENLWWALDKKLTVEDAKRCAYATLIESVRNGVTTVFDHHASPHHIEGSLFAIADAARQLGVRADLCYEVSDRDGVDIMRRGIRENLDFIRYTKEHPDEALRAHFGIHASFTISDATMEEIAEAMAGVDTGYHIHTAEGIEDEYDALAKYGRRVIERLHDWNMLGEKSLCIHCCNVSAKEMDILATSSTPVVHNPASNMNNAVGVTPVLSMLRRGIVTGLGTDAYTNDMFASLQTAKVLQSHHLADPTVGFAESLALLFTHNLTIAQRTFGEPVGVLRPGAAGDLITLEYHPYTPLGADSFWGHILFGLSGRQVCDTIIRGRFVMKNREIQTVDEEAIFARSRTRAQEVWAQMQ